MPGTATNRGSTETTTTVSSAAFVCPPPARLVGSMTPARTRTSAGASRTWSRTGHTATERGTCTDGRTSTYGITTTPGRSADRFADFSSADRAASKWGGDVPDGQGRLLVSVRLLPLGQRHVLVLQRLV